MSYPRAALKHGSSPGATTFITRRPTPISAAASFSPPSTRFRRGRSAAKRRRRRFAPARPKRCLARKNSMRRSPKSSPRKALCLRRRKLSGPLSPRSAPSSSTRAAGCSASRRRRCGVASSRSGFGDGEGDLSPRLFGSRKLGKRRRRRLYRRRASLLEKRGHAVDFRRGNGDRRLIGTGVAVGVGDFRRHSIRRSNQDPPVADERAKCGARHNRAPRFVVRRLYRRESSPPGMSSIENLRLSASAGSPASAAAPSWRVRRSVSITPPPRR